MQAYSDPEREEDPHALPDVEVFFMSYAQFMTAEPDSWMSDAIQNWQSDLKPVDSHEAAKGLEGFYWWSCFPGCLPDGEPNGPFKTEAEALKDAQDF